MPTSPGNSHAHQHQSLSTQVLQIPTVRKKSWYNFPPIMDIRQALALLHDSLRRYDALAGREATSMPTSPGNSHAHQHQSLSTQVLQIPTVRKNSWYNFPPIMDIHHALALLHRILGEIWCLWLEGRPHQCQPPPATAMLINIKVCPHRCSKFPTVRKKSWYNFPPHHGHSPCSSIAPQDSWGDMMSLAGREATSMPTSAGNSHAHQHQSLSTQVLQIPTVR